MVFLEAVFNGKILFTVPCVGANEVLKDLPHCIFKDFGELVEKISNLYKINKEKLIDNYRLIEKSYSRKSVAQNIIATLGGQKSKQ